jgi:hypothetical protein
MAYEKAVSDTCKYDNEWGLTHQMIREAGSLLSR